MKVVAFNCSPKPKGNTAQLLQKVLDAISVHGIFTELVQVGGRPLHGCRACARCKANQDGRCAMDDDTINEYIEAMRESDGILIGSPTYFSDLTAEAKALIDRAGYVARANGDLFKRKLGAAVVAVRRAGGIHAFDSINHFFLVNHMIVPGSSYWNIAIGRDPGDVNSDAEGLATMENLGDNMAWLLQRIAKQPQKGSVV